MADGLWDRFDGLDATMRAVFLVAVALIVVGAAVWTTAAGRVQITGGFMLVGTGVALLFGVAIRSRDDGV